MITEAFCNVIFSVINWIFGYFPAVNTLHIAEKVTDIFGYGVWLLGDDVFTAISVIGMSEVVGVTAFSFVVFVWRLLRG